LISPFLSPRPKPKTTNRPAAPQRRPACRAVAADAAAATASASSSSRRAALAALLLGTATTALFPLKARAQANVLCTQSETDADAADCRRAALAQDELKTYTQASARAAEAERTAPNVPVAKLDSQYARDTTALQGRIAEYVAIPAADARARAPLVKQLRADCQKWASSYARGGSARSQSARSMYVAVDAVMGHLASNGVAPLPSAKLREVGASLEASAGFLAEGR
jgi:hypothetical protein